MRIVRLLAVSLAFLALSGCTSDKFKGNVPRRTVVTSPFYFSDENYVWEDFLFPTNRTTRR